MVSVCFYFEVHQPRRLKPGWRINLRGVESFEEFEKCVFDDATNEKIMKKVAEKCYIPATKLILSLVDNFRWQKKKFKVTYSLSGVFLEQAKRYVPEIVDLFRWLADTGCAEFLAETYYHSLSSLWISNELEDEFEEQVRMHSELIKDEIGYRPSAFRNTELIFNNQIAEKIEEMGFKAMLAEGIEFVLNGRSPEHVYVSYGTNLPVLLRHYRLSDDVSFRFSARWFEAWPLTADKYAAWIAACQGEVINLFMDYETFGEHQWEDTGIFEFLKYLPYELLKYEHVDFVTVSEAVERYPPRGVIDVPGWQTISWADMERDLSAWLGNEMQKVAFRELEKIGRKLMEHDIPAARRLWRYLQTSDHLYYCCTKHWSDGDVHKYFSPYGTPHEAFEGMMKVLTHLQYLMGREVERADGAEKNVLPAKNGSEDGIKIRVQEPVRVKEGIKKMKD